MKFAMFIAWVGVLGLAISNIAVPSAETFWLYWGSAWLTVAGCLVTLLA